MIREKGRFYVVGVGPGDPELMTLKAVRILKACDTWLSPSARANGESAALSIAARVVPTTGKEILSQHFPMKKVLSCGKTRPESAPEVEKAWQDAAATIIERLKDGRDVAFPTLGDPAFYSTGFYVCDAILGLAPDVEFTVIPGVSSLGASSARLNMPLCIGDERVTVVPATYENSDLREIIESSDTVVLMKVHRVMARIVRLLEEMGLSEHAHLVELCGQEGEQITRGLSSDEELTPHYFSTIIIRRR